MRVAFRADASLQIGTGHVMRCLTLADALKANGAECYFICREHSGNLLSFIQNKGYTVYTLPYLEADAADSIAEEAHLAHAEWLGASQQQDAEQCRAILTSLQPDWLIVDHYALDTYWEKVLSAYYRRLMVIDDLADRPHDCDILLDQTFGRNADDYRSLVPDNCVLLCGSSYALLRPEFSTLRAYSLQRRENPKLEHLLITMGGVDKDNATGQVLEALRTCELPEQCRITVVMGATAPWLVNIRQLAADMPWPTTVKVNVSDMAQLMADSDLAIGAAGATSWERCCLGLPTAMIVLADNQTLAAVLLDQAKAVTMLRLDDLLQIELSRHIEIVNREPFVLKNLSMCARVITDGTGCQKVETVLKGFNF